VYSLAVINHKGGSGKTTTAVNLGAAMAELGRRVLLVDLDPQGSSTTWLRCTPKARDTYEALLGDRDLSFLVTRTFVGGLELVPASPRLASERWQEQRDLSVGTMRALQGLPHRWDLVLIDCPPMAGYISMGVLGACNDVLVPVEAHAIALSGVAGVATDVARVRANLNPSLDLAAILPCRVNRTIHAREVLEELRERYGSRVMSTTVRESIRLPEAAAAQLPITAYAPRSTGAQDYRAAAIELLRRAGRRIPGPRYGEAAAGA
jgi:chromosome partitioning protein